MWSLCDTETHREKVMWQQRQSLGDAMQATSEARKRWGRFLPQSFRGSVTFVICHLVTVSTLYLTLYDPMDCSLPCCSVHGISQARILEWVAISFSRGPSRLRGHTCISCIGRQILRESVPRQVDKESRGPQGERGLEFSRRKKGQTFFFLSLHSLGLYNNNVSCLRTVFGLNLLANPVILKCKLWE